jgi:hypothetical protein
MWRAGNLRSCIRSWRQGSKEGGRKSRFFARKEASKHTDAMACDKPAKLTFGNAETTKVMDWFMRSRETEIVGIPDGGCGPRLSFPDGRLGIDDTWIQRFAVVNPCLQSSLEVPAAEAVPACLNRRGIVRAFECVDGWP